MNTKIKGAFLWLVVAWSLSFSGALAQNDGAGTVIDLTNPNMDAPLKNLMQQEYLLRRQQQLQQESQRQAEERQRAMAEQQQKVQNNIIGVKKWYASQSYHPSVEDGWVFAYVTDNATFCGSYKVLVKDGKAIVLHASDNREFNITEGTQISKASCKGNVNIYYNGKVNSIPSDFYFFIPKATDK
jgi:hypothetical protein